jgi:hypothetical protein
VQQHRVGWNAVAFGQDDQVAPHHVASGDALARAVADDQGTRAGEIAQGLQHPLGAGLLDDGNGDGDVGEEQQDDRFAEIAEHEIDGTAGQQQRQHRLGQDFEQDSPHRAPVAARQFVRPVALQTALGLLVLETAFPRHDRHRTFQARMSVV